MTQQSKLGESNDMPEQECLLPDRIQPFERHWRRLQEGMHPFIDYDDEYRDVVGTQTFDGSWPVDPDEYGRIFHNRDGDRLIGFMERGRCPICGQTGSLSVSSGVSSAFVWGIENPDYSDVENPREYAGEETVVDDLGNRGWNTIECRATATYENRGDSSGSFYVGMASDGAYADWKDWNDARSDRGAFRAKAHRATRKKAYPEDLVKPGKYTHGDLLGAIYELLGAETYDPRELMGRKHVTKEHLAVIVDRLASVDVTERRDLSNEDWLVHQDFGVNNGVQWHIPEWADFDGLNYSDQYRQRIFE